MNLAVSMLSMLVLLSSLGGFFNFCRTDFAASMFPDDGGDILLVERIGEIPDGSSYFFPLGDVPGGSCFLLFFGVVELATEELGFTTSPMWKSNSFIISCVGASPIELSSVSAGSQPSDSGTPNVFSSSPEYARSSLRYAVSAAAAVELLVGFPELPGHQVCAISFGTIPRLWLLPVSLMLSAFLPRARLEAVKSVDWRTHGAERSLTAASATFCRPWTVARLCT
mmetsp:Transcript_13398/g.27723  ORF Transcript_13398/g.27723 Transcript_13398/m.27723 type:complete len:225 (+) Transcript_13398:1724-2398(+)